MKIFYGGQMIKNKIQNFDKTFEKDDITNTEIGDSSGKKPFSSQKISNDMTLIQS